MHDKSRLFVCGILLFAAWSTVGLIAQDIPYFTTHFPAEEFVQRRAAVYEAIGPEAIAVVQGAAFPYGYVKFRQSNEFYYLCGVEVPHAYLVLNGAAKTTAIFLPHRNERRERSEGKHLTAESKEEVKRLTGVDEVHGTEFLGEHLARLSYRGGTETLFTSLFPAEGMAVSRDLASISIGDNASDPWDGRPSREGRFIQLLRQRFPKYSIKDLSPILDDLRVIKSPREIALIKRSTRLAGEAIAECMRSTEPGVYEYELAALAQYIHRRNGAQGDAYYALAACGPNCEFPHYHRGKRKLEDGDLFLLDYAPDYEYYMSDLTRTWPANGKFEGWQRELYGFYAGCYQAIIKAMRPGVKASAIKRNAVVEMEAILTRSTFSKKIYENACRDFVANYKYSTTNPSTRLGHWVGMSTHDVGRDTGPLRPGMVYTIEPALRVPEEHIYIRAEDLFVVTRDKVEVVSDFLPLTIEDIERCIREEGLLQKYPAIP